ncbi:MAG: hypothetical protein ABIH85_07285 [Candidatus Omnitrophota bacterium]
MKNRFKLKKLRKELDVLSKKHDAYLQSKEYKNLSKELKNKEQAEFYQGKYMLIWEQIKEIEQEHILMKLNKYGIPYPSKWEDKEEKYWEAYTGSGKKFLTTEGYHLLRNDLRNEMKARRDMILGWVPLIVAIAGVLGSITAILTIVRYWNY